MFKKIKRGIASKIQKQLLSFMITVIVSHRFLSYQLIKLHRPWSLRSLQLQRELSLW